jgi:hypothetical protein
MGWTDKVQFPEGARDFYTTASQPALGLNQPPLQWAVEAFSLGLSDRDVKLTTRLHLMPRSRILELYFHSSIPLHGVVLN